jgi:hypothetical protein
LDVQADWRWQKLKITIDPTGRIAAAYGKQRQSHTFTKANKPAHAATPTSAFDTNADYGETSDVVAILKRQKS